MKPGILFVCLGNSCRSIMAEALTRHYLGDSVTAASAGLNPLGFITPETLQVLIELGIEVEGLYSKGLSHVDPEAYSLLINLTSRPVTFSLPPDCRHRLRNRPVPDPYGGSLELYRQCRDRIRELIISELAALFH
jgi:arsenate reductase